jgi:outer membrane immunogenic protein
MKKLKLLFAGLATIASGAAAKAADIMPARAYKAPPAVAPMPAFSWTGCHVGVHGGAGWGRQAVDARSSGAIIASDNVHSDGAIFGGQIGCDRDFANGWVVGLEGDIAATHLKGSVADPFFLAGSDNSIRTDARWLASVTGRVGFTGLLPQTLLYVKGGAAWVHEKYTINSVVIELNGEFDKTNSGWTAGGGIAWAVAPDWSVFAEYNHYDFRNGFSIATPGPGTPLGINFDGSRINTVKVGLNFRFGG